MRGHVIHAPLDLIQRQAAAARPDVAQSNADATIPAPQRTRISARMSFTGE